MAVNVSSRRTVYRVPHQLSDRMSLLTKLRLTKKVGERELGEHEVKPKAKDGEAKYLVSARVSLPISFASLSELSPLILPFSLLLSATEFGLGSKVEACFC